MQCIVVLQLLHLECAQQFLINDCGMCNQVFLLVTFGRLQDGKRQFCDHAVQMNREK